MINGKKILAIIPARGGSKRIHKKNIADLNGKPLLAYTIELAKQINALDKIVVSSDDEEILSVASSYGAEAFKRPAELSLDAIKDEPVLLNVIDILEKKGEFFDYIVLLQATSPLRRLLTVKNVIIRAINDNFDVMGTVIEDRNYFWKFFNETWTPLFADAPRRSQERAPLYKEAGVCYVMKSKTLKKTGKIFAGKIGFAVVDEVEGLDINTPLDLELANFFKLK